MDIREFLISPVDIKINQDWQRVTEMAKDLIHRSKTQYSEIKPVGNTNYYHLGPLGSVGHHYVSLDWHFVGGPWVNKYLPWAQQMLDDMKDLNPNFVLSVANGDIAEHIDFDTYPTAVNYPIYDTDAETYVLDQDREYKYPSLKDQAWMLNTQYPHGVRNTGTRVVITMKFATDYQTTRAWFDAHPGLIYG